MAQRTFSKGGHTHQPSEVTGLQTALDGKANSQHTHDWNQVTGKPTSFLPTAHSHTIPEVSGLQTALDTKAGLTHTHSQLHDRQHSIISTQDHVFPGGATTFLRADGVFATVTGADGNATSLQGRPVSPTQPSGGQVLKWSGSVWEPATDLVGEGGGTGGAVSSVNGQIGDVSLNAASVGADPAGAAAAAQAASVQRANHTGSQAISTVVGLQTALDGKTAPAQVDTIVATHNANQQAHTNLIRYAGTAQNPITNMNQARPLPPGVGVVHWVVNGIEPSFADPNDFIRDIMDGNAVSEQELQIALETKATLDDPRFPTSNEKAALTGSTGAPSNANRFVTDQDARLSDSRVPLAHTHSAVDINAGTLAIARIPTGTTSSTVSLGNHTHTAATTSTPGFMAAVDKTKLDGVATGATANATDAQLRDRATHTGAQAISTVTGLQTALDARVLGTGITSIVALTLSQYNATSPRPATTLYIITSNA
jgi:hypothetical protein